MPDRACKSCGLLKPLSQFRSNGCENCPMLSKDYTSSKYKGLVALVQPDLSWVGKWQRLGVKGLYAMTVEGTLSDENVFEIEKGGKEYYDRSESFKL